MYVQHLLQAENKTANDRRNEKKRAEDIQVEIENQSTLLDDW